MYGIFVCCWEEHAIDFRLISAWNWWNHKLFSFKVFLHDQYTLVQIAKKHSRILFLCTASNTFVKPCASTAWSITAHKKIAANSTKCILGFSWLLNRQSKFGYQIFKNGHLLLTFFIHLDSRNIGYSDITWSYFLSFISFQWFFVDLIEYFKIVPKVKSVCFIFFITVFVKHVLLSAVKDNI